MNYIADVSRAINVFQRPEEEQYENIADGAYGYSQILSSTINNNLNQLLHHQDNGRYAEPIFSNTEDEAADQQIADSPFATYIADASRTINVSQRPEEEQYENIADGAYGFSQIMPSTINNNLNQLLHHQHNGRYAEPMFNNSEDEAAEQEIADPPLLTLCSSYWLRLEDFYIGLDVTYNQPEYLHNLYQIFIQKCFQTNDINFGIDNHKFMVNFPYQHCYYDFVPDDKENSIYWFSSGELLTSFVGKPMSTIKIFRLFAFIQAGLEENGSLSLGVDNENFSSFFLQAANNMNNCYDSSNYVRTNTPFHYENLETNTSYQIPYDLQTLDSSLNLTTEHTGFPRATTSDEMSFAAYTDKFSKFWIRSGDFHIGLKIVYIPPEELFESNKIYIQENAQTKDVSFGIDNYKFNANDPCQPFSYHHGLLPEYENFSTYWFLSGNLFFNVVGKRLTHEKIQRLFTFIKDNAEESSVLQFGIDFLEFSHIPDFWN